MSYQDESGSCAGVLLGEEIVPVRALGAPSNSVRGILASLDAAALAEMGERAAAEGERMPVAESRLLAPVPDPQKIICLGLNYRDHAAESGQEIPTAPMWFAKFANSLIGSGEDIVPPDAHPDYVDYEAELAIVIGHVARDVAVADALDHVAGAMPFNDVSARDLQFQNPLWTSGKAIDTFAPCGPALVTLDEIDDLRSLGLRTRVNGELLQEGNTRELIFGVPETVSWLSRTMTLLPGDIIATGTPAGVGASKNRFLRDGDTVAVEVDGLGALVNTVRRSGL
ncbi:MAG TPA: fumarylacetoacetate hydrolase family protein [Solirubrobacteraceae bacterium]|nr:fumarylacetoacetate hydrolase family protein [Solirubrobacteraceae bacterium]